MLSQNKILYYLVELRMWNDGTAFPYIRNRVGYTKDYLNTEKFKIISKTNEVAEIQCGRFVITIKQFVFKELTAARLHFENLKKLKDTDMQEAYEVSLMQVEATSVNNARILPPNSYVDKNTVWLETFEPHLSRQEYRQHQSVTNNL
jgi:hypothetical protein